uniref:Uncharacterized protein n=1 Tax=Mycena chlorophos TaxID=658473 RepID=A0ABQ0LNK7_MYCCL|nr:predicted protein [Mycena chlorophos]
MLTGTHGVVRVHWSWVPRRDGTVAWQPRPSTQTHSPSKLATTALFPRSTVETPTCAHAPLVAERASNAVLRRDRDRQPPLPSDFPPSIYPLASLSGRYDPACTRAPAAAVDERLAVQLFLVEEAVNRPSRTMANDRHSNSSDVFYTSSTHHRRRRSVAHTAMRCAPSTSAALTVPDDDRSRLNCASRLRLRLPELLHKRDPRICPTAVRR